MINDCRNLNVNNFAHLNILKLCLFLFVIRSVLVVFCFSILCFGAFESISVNSSARCMVHCAQMECGQKRTRTIAPDLQNITAFDLNSKSSLALLADAYASSDSDSDSDPHSHSHSASASKAPLVSVSVSKPELVSEPVSNSVSNPAPVYASPALEALSACSPSSGGWVYELALQDGCFYVGFTRRAVAERAQEHWNGNGSGAAWTTVHAPVCVVQITPGNEMNEHIRTLQLAAEFGVDKVRGSGWGHVSLDPAQLRDFRLHVASTQDLCYTCHARGHKARECPNSSQSSTSNSSASLTSSSSSSLASRLSDSPSNSPSDSPIDVSLWAKIPGPYNNRVTLRANKDEGFDVVYSGQRILPGKTRGFSDHLIQKGAAFFFASGSEPWTLAGIVQDPVTRIPPAARGDTWRYAFRVRPHAAFADGTRPPLKVKDKTEALRALRMRIPETSSLSAGIVKH